MIDTYRQKAGYFFFKRGLSKITRKVKTTNLENANRIGILYSADDAKTYLTISEYIKYLREEGIKEIEALAIFDGKEIPEYLISKRSMNHICQKQLNWHYKPFGPIVENFINTKFDILIDLTTAKSLPVLYLQSQTEAKFKVGKYNAELENLYDLMIDVKEGTDLSYYIAQLNHYLSMINAK